MALQALEPQDNAPQEEIAEPTQFTDDSEITDEVSESDSDVVLDSEDNALETDEISDSDSDDDNVSETDDNVSDIENNNSPSNNDTPQFTVMDNEEIYNNTDYKRETGHEQKIKVIGVGGGGNNAVNHMFDQGISEVSFVLINTDRQVLAGSKIPTKLLLGPGLGAGGNPNKAKQFAEENAEQIADLFADNTDMVFITAGMGGGTGTGAGPVVARIAKEMGILTVGIVTIPFLFEGKKRILTALEGADEMSKNVDALMVINNERLTEIYNDMDIFAAFAHADDTLLEAAKGITEIITIPGQINRDFEDVDSTLRDGGTAIISSGFGEGESRVTKAINDALHTPLLKNTDICSAKKLLMILYVSDNPEDVFTMSEAGELTDFVGRIDSEVDVKWGLYKIPGLGKKVKITILASGFSVTVKTGPTKTAQPQTAETKAESNKISDEYGQDRIKDQTRRGAMKTYTILNPEDFEDEEKIQQVETPTFQRGRSQYSQVNRTIPQRPSTNDNTEKTIDFSSLD